jgi:RimJ/RimL family protein N-acetyltransferase
VDDGVTAPLRGELVGLRARHEPDVAILEAELHDDVAGDARGSRRAWRPRPPTSKESFNRVTEPNEGSAPFSVVELATDTLAGEASLWNIDSHNRSAHIGVALRPAFRGKGFGTDIVRIVCYYGFTVLGLHRLQVDTLSDNHAMIKAAEQVGFIREGVIRGSAWVLGEFADDLILGLLADEWSGLRHVGE